MIGGVPCSGKSTLMKSILQDLGDSKSIEPMKLFRCQKHNDILVIGDYSRDTDFGGTDRLSYGVIKKFRSFIEQEYPKHRHILCEGDRFFRSVELEWLLDNYDTQIYILEISHHTERERHLQRQDNQSEVWLKSRRKLIENVKTNFVLMDYLNIRNTQRNDVKCEILTNLYSE